MRNPSTSASAEGPARGRTTPAAVPLCRAALVEAAAHLLALALFFSVLNRFTPVPGVTARGAIAVMVLMAVHAPLWCRPATNRLPGPSLIAPQLGGANRISLLRGLLISLTAGFLFLAPQGDSPAASFMAWLPGGLYLAAAVLDGVDGAWARRTRTESPLGRILDTHIDALGVLVASAVAVSTHRLPAYYLAAGLAYYLFQFGLWCRRRRGRSIHPAGSRRFARLVAGFQMGFLAVALLPVFSREVLALAAPVFLLPLLAGFVWDWQVVRGRAAALSSRRGRDLLAALAAKGPPALRAAILLAGVGGLFLWPLPSFSGGLLLALVLGLMVVVGFLGRTAALLLGLGLAGRASAAAASPFLMAILTGALIIMMTGTGDASLWRPEDRLLMGTPGEQVDGRAPF